MQLTFLEGFQPLTKKFTTTGVTAYPLVKKVTSHEYFIPHTFDGLQEKTRLLQEHAEKGHAMLKGPLTKRLENESRAGCTDNNAPTHNIIIDIDGFTLAGETLKSSLVQADIAYLASRCVAILPESFQNVSYIVHASSSLGLKANTVSMHLDFMLSAPIQPDFLKRWLQYMNFTLPVFNDQLSLTATGTALRYKLDVSLADNSRIVYIAAPAFEGVTNPIPEDKDRIFLIRHDKIAVEPPASAAGMSRETIAKQAQIRVNNIRDSLGLGARKECTTPYRFDNSTTYVVVNPDGVRMNHAYVNGKYVYYNLANGDSNAYYVHKFKPQIVWNFKGEPPFLFEQADPETYQWHIDTYIRGNTAAEAEFEPEPIGFRDRITDTFFNGTINRAKNTLVALHKTHRAGISDWYQTYGGAEPDYVPVWEYRFDPTDPRTLDIPQKFINQYTPSALMSNPPEIAPEYVGIDYEHCTVLEGLCPNIFKLLRSVTGNGETELTHFVNWLAYIVCERKKTQTAWILHGTEGTGKGLLFTRVLQPILGEQYAVQIRVENLDEQYNSWLEKALIVMVDEFKFTSAKNKESLLEKLRNYITEPTVTIRGMRENVRSVQNYANLLICGNERDMMRPSEEDRRYNIAPRQDTKLFTQFPELRGNLHLIDEEVPQFAAALLQFKVSIQHVRTPLDNEAKRLMRTAARTVVEDFYAALRKGDLDFFMQIMEMEDEVGLDSLVSSAKNIMRGILARYDEELGVGVLSKHLHTLFRAMTGNTKIPLTPFGKMLARDGFVTGILRIPGDRGCGLYIKFQHPDIASLKAQYLVNYPNNVTPMTGV